MDRTFADAIILDALSRDPERVRDAVAKVARDFVESGRYSAEEVAAGVDELRDANWRDTFSPSTNRPFARF
jgi:hypothetical protein